MPITRLDEGNNVLWDTFIKCDKNSDGYLNATEFASFMKRLYGNVK